MKQIAVLGSTGSIGKSCLEVAAAHPDRVTVFGLAAHRSSEQLAAQCQRFRPALAVLADPAAAAQCDRSQFPAETELRFGPEAVAELAAHAAVDVVISGIVGAAGLAGTWAALERGKTVGLANKETLVVGGSLVTQLAAERGAQLIPVDSEHSAVFQAIAAGRREDLERIILTASGGPFRDWTRERMAAATPAMALAHPTWQMGPKITIDSATMMNKALELIEARWLFDLPADRIDVVIHPQSIVHSLVEFRDGSVVAQLSPPDMCLPIQYALSYPERWSGVSPRLDLTRPLPLTFEPPDDDRFPALALGRQVARQGGSCGAVLNAANEVAVGRFLEGSLPFMEIPRVCRAVLENHTYDSAPTLAQLWKLDAWARQETFRWKP